MEAQDLSGQEKESLADGVMGSMGMSKEDGNEAATSPEHQDAGEQDDLPEGVKARLGRQEKRHQREMKQMQARIEAMAARFEQPSYSEHQQEMNPYDNGAGQQPPAGVDEQIHKAVSYALQHREMQERKAKEAESMAHVQRQHEALRDHLHSMGDKYDDFHEVVFGNDVPISTHMRDASMFLPKTGPGSAGEVFYKLGKNRTELERISKLHPLDQASEMVRLSNALIAGSGDKGNPQAARPMGNVKNNPVTNTHAITEKTPISDLRKRMKNGWK
jgi:hypothetical protein